MNEAELRQEYAAVSAAAQELPGSLRENAEQLIERMTSVIEGIGDKPIRWSPPFLRVVQPTTTDVPDDARIGTMLLGEDQLPDPTRFIPIRTWYSRELLEKQDGGSAAPRRLCSSPDAKTGSKYGTCYTCPHSQWIEGEGSACRKQVNVLAITDTLDKVFSITFKGTSYSSGTDLEARMKKAGVAPYKRIYALTNKPHPKQKQIRQLLTEVADDNRVVNPAVLEFLRVFSEKVNNDRATHLARFADYMQSRSTQAAIGNDNNAGYSEVPAPSTTEDTSGSEVDSGSTKSYDL